MSSNSAQTAEEQSRPALQSRDVNVVRRINILKDAIVAEKNPPLSADAELTRQMNSPRDSILADEANAKSAMKGARGHATEKPAASKKRKSSETQDADIPIPHIDVDEYLLLTPTDTAQVVRRKITDLVESGAMKVKDFQTAAGISPSSYSNFMRQYGTNAGQFGDAYPRAFRYLQALEMEGFKIPKPNNKSKKAKASAEQLYDTAGIELEGENITDVPVYDTCDVVRTKIRAFLRKDGITQAGLCREVAKTFPDARKIPTSKLAYFMKQHGPCSGSASDIFYASYVFFEKQRIRDGKPKTAFRKQMEAAWDGSGSWKNSRPGFDRTVTGNTSWLCMGSERPYVDRYGRLDIH